MVTYEFEATSIQDPNPPSTDAYVPDENFTLKIFDDASASVRIQLEEDGQRIQELAAELKTRTERRNKLINCMATLLELSAGNSDETI